MVDSGASMHMLSKKKGLGSGELETLRKSRNTTTAVTANGEVQASQDAQVYVHGLELFVTVQIFEHTPAVLSSGKLCEEHGYTCELASGQKPQLTMNGKRFLCKTAIVVPTVVPGLSSSSSASSASTPLPQDSTGIFPSPAIQRSVDTHAQASGNRGDPPRIKKNEKTDNNRAARSRLRVLTEWLEEFTDNLDDTA